LNVKYLCWAAHRSKEIVNQNIKTVVFRSIYLYGSFSW